MTEPDATTRPVPQPREVLLESREPDRVTQSWRGYFVHGHDQHGRPLYDGEGRPVLVQDGRQPPVHPLDRSIAFVLVLLVLLLLAVCIIGGIGLHYLDEIRTTGGSITFG